MKTGTKLAVIAAVLVAAGYFGLRRGAEKTEGAGVATPATKSAAPTPSLPAGATTTRNTSVPAGAGATPAERAALVEKIRHDYDEIRAKMSSEFATAGAAFPGGVSAFLRQLALLEREMHADVAKVLPPRELEDYEMRETTTGKTQLQRLAGLQVTEETQRAAFRLRKQFDDRFALAFDVTPTALLERERARQEMLVRLRLAVDEATFDALVGPEDVSYAGFRVLAAQRGLPPKVAADIWRMKNDYTVRKLEIMVQAGLSNEQRTAMQAALAAQIRSNVSALVGPDAVVAGGDALGWLPLAK
jgi:hypothetical protein